LREARLSLADHVYQLRHPDCGSGLPRLESRPGVLIRFIAWATQTRNNVVRHVSELGEQRRVLRNLA